MKGLRFVVLAIVGLALIVAPGAVSSEDDTVYCCKRPCTCLPNAKPTCTKIDRIECEREKGEIVADCMLCD